MLKTKVFRKFSVLWCCASKYWKNTVLPPILQESGQQTPSQIFISKHES